MKKIISIILSVGIAINMLPFNILTVSAKTNINIGDYIEMGTYYGEPILWRCVDIDENGPLILSDKIICLKPFDSSGNSTIGSHRRGYDSGDYRKEHGSNYWADSNIRSWLNSNESAGEVTWLCGNAPDNLHSYKGGYNDYSNEAGFETNFTVDELSIVKTVCQDSLLGYGDYSKATQGNTYHIYNESISEVVQNAKTTAYREQVEDDFFLLDVNQISAVYNNRNILGEDYYIGEPTLQAVSNSEYKNSLLKFGSKWYTWLRTPSNKSSGRIFGIYVMDVQPDGTIGDIHACYGPALYEGVRGVRPAFYLSDNANFIGDGSENNPYILSLSNNSYHANYRSDLIENASLEFDYSDKYFIDSNGYTYNHNLAKATLALELSSWTAKGADNGTTNERMANIRNLYEQLEFKDIVSYNYDKALDDNADKVAYSFATKKLYDGSTLVSVVVRGGGYGAEWRSNLHVGTGSKHTGFNTPAEDIYNNLDIYLSLDNLDKDNTKIWITGYSRGAAIANIVAGRINETGLINSDNLYAYTFATPNGVKIVETGANSSIHNNIYNIVLPYDFVPKVAMANWGYGRYGQTLMVKNINISSNKNHEKYFFNHTNKSYSVGKPQTAAAFHLRNALSAFGENQINYVSKYEGLIMDIIEWAMYRSAAKDEDLTDFVFTRYGGHEKFSKALSHAYPYMSDYSDFSTLYKMGIDSSMVYSIVVLMYMNGIEMSENETIDFIVNKIGDVLKAMDLVGVFSVMNGASGTIDAHNPEYYIAWLFGYDNPKDIYESSTYKKLTIACPVNVNVYDSYGELVVSVVNNEIAVDVLPVDVFGESAEIYFYEGEDIGDYTIEIEAYDEGSVNYSVTEYENNGVETRKINYANIPVSTGTKLSGNVPKGQNLEAELYNLTSVTDGEETSVAYTDDLTDEDLQNLTVDVTVEGDGVANDIYFATKGDLVVLEATPYHDAAFLGWYDENDELISSNQQYSFVLSEDMNVVAKFTKCTAVIFTSAPKISGNDLSINTSVSSAKDIDGQYIIAIYSGDNKLLDTKIIPTSLVGNTEKKVNETFNVSLLENTPTYAKLFLWSSFDDLIPLCSSTKANVQ